MKNRLLLILLSCLLILSGCDNNLDKNNNDTNINLDDTNKPGDSTDNSGNPNENEEKELFSLTIQENSSLVTTNGFVATSGFFDDNKSGFTGDGFIGYLGADSYIQYSVNAETAGTYNLSFRYANQDSKLTASTDRDANIIVNGVKVEVSDGSYTLACYPTGGNDSKGDLESWEFTDTVEIELIEGDNDIRIVPAGVKLPNTDCLLIEGYGELSYGSNSTQFYTVTADSLNSNLGSISVSPDQEYYLQGTEITLTATVINSGYEFSSWTGTAPSTDSTYIFSISDDVEVSARFLPLGTTQPSGIMGFATVQDDNATPYIITGGLGGEEVTVTTLTELTTALTSTEPKIVYVSGLITTAGEASTSINVESNKTIKSDETTQGHIKNIELKLSGENYIIQDMILSEVIAADIYGGTGNDIIQLNGARHVWVDHCEMYSSLELPPVDIDGNNVINTDDAKDYYDGLLDIKNGARFITLSNNYFHDHYKAILVGSGDDLTNEPIDSKIRLTMYGNIIEDISSRTPLIRYGKAHVINNYYLGDDITLDSTVNARCGSEVLVEGNYFQNCKRTVGFYYDTSGFPTGTWNLLDNIWESCNSSYHPVDSTGSWTPSYDYNSFAKSSSEITNLLLNNTGPRS